MNKNIIIINGNSFETLLAISNEEQQKGLMYVDPPTPIMTFIYRYPSVNKFWMANTRAALDILFCLGGKITSICSGIPYSLSLIGNDDLSDLVIELPAGTCSTYNITVGNSINMQYADENKMKVLMLKSGIRI